MSLLAKIAENIKIAFFSGNLFQELIGTAVFGGNPQHRDIGIREKPFFRVRKREVFGVSNPRAGCPRPTRGSAENNSLVMPVPPTTDLFVAGRDLTRPVRVSLPLLDLT